MPSRNSQSTLSYALLICLLYALRVLEQQLGVLSIFSFCKLVWGTTGVGNRIFLADTAHWISQYVVGMCLTYYCMGVAGGDSLIHSICLVYAGCLSRVGFTWSGQTFGSL
jgi:hypothetical protein